jgi:ubiquinone/menaquinone biosynthesis C-methylase UbiE
MIKRIFENMFNNSMKLNEKNILKMLRYNPEAKILDLGCDDGEWTLKIAKKVKTRNIHGIEIIEEKINLCKEKGIMAKKGDLNKKFPFENEEFDIVHANQVIEHISDLDNFLSEISRILKKGGYIIISTENASSWHNIFASIMGWQIFSLTNISSKKMGIGNPLAIHRGNKIELSSWTHKTIFNYLGLREFIETYGFKIIKISGAGYYPFPSFFGNIDKKHSHFLTVKAYKK